MFWSPSSATGRSRCWKSGAGGCSGDILRESSGVQRRGGETAVLLGRNWIKLHLHSHKEMVLRRMADGRAGPESSARDTVSSFIAPAQQERQKKNVTIQTQ